MGTLEESKSEFEQLSAHDLQDLVTAAMAASDIESSYLLDTLEDAGIPVSNIRQSAFRFGESFVDRGQVILVPRKLLERAQAVVEKARAAARNRGLDAAFEEQFVEESTEDNDPRMQHMVALRAEEPVARRRLLAEEIVSWSAEGVTDLQAARYLAAAGLDQEEANFLVKAALMHGREALEQRVEASRDKGWLLVILAVILTGVSAGLYAMRISNITLLLLGPLVLGLLLLHRASRKPLSLEKTEENSSCESDGSGRKK